jgi:phage baseplate assembly protein W
MDESYLAFPFRIGPDGAVARADRDQTIRSRIEQVLFTSSRERVMLPEFGCDGEKLLIEITYTKSRDLQRENVVFQMLPFAGDNRA